MNLPNFAMETLTQIYLAEEAGNPIHKSHGWCTARGNSISSIKEVLIPNNLVKEVNGNFLTTRAGQKVVLSSWLKIITKNLPGFIN